MDQRFESSRLRNDPSLLIILVTILFGLVFGSFINVLIFRLPQNLSIVRPGSRCISCNNHLKWWMNIPILSFIFLKGRCAFCSVKISIQYPLIEITCGVFFLLFFDLSQPFTSVGLSLAFCLLLAVAVIDFRHFIIHHALLAASFICFLPAVIHHDFVWQYHLAGMLFCPGFIWLVSQTVKLVNKRDNLGAGDVLLGFVLGFYLGPYLSMIMYSIASVLGIVYWLIASKSNRGENDPVQIPFGTGMVVGMIVLEMLLLPKFLSSCKFLEIIVFTDGFVAEMLSLL